jgi:hypothetical protein
MLSARNIRSYLAGTGASGALVAATVVALLTVGALFAFEGMPGDSAPAEEDSVFVGSAGAPGAAATAVAGAPGAVAATPAPLPPAAVDALLVAAGPDGGLPAGAPTGPGAPTIDGGTLPVPAAPTTAPAPTPTSSPGTVGNIVNGVGQATGNPGLGQATQPVTDPVDQTLDQTGVGGTVDQTLEGVNNTVGGLLGGGG